MYERIKGLCNTKGITINYLEKELGFSHGLISKWKKHSPGIDKLEKIAKYFGVTIDCLCQQEK